MSRRLEAVALFVVGVLIAIALAGALAYTNAHGPAGCPDYLPDCPAATSSSAAP